MSLRFAFSVLLVLFTHFHFLLPLVLSQGLTLDECSSSQECVGPRRCWTRSRTECQPSSRSCRCLPLSPIDCLSDDACPEGERCIVLRAAVSSPAFCASVQGAASVGGTVELVTPPNPTEGSLTFETCTRNRDCLAPRICLLPTQSFEMCVGRFSCVCLPPVFQECQNDSDCPEGEACGLEGISICVAEGLSNGRTAPIPRPTAITDPDFVEDATENGNENENGDNSTEVVTDTSTEVITITSEVCVAEKHMKGVKGIYENGRLAHVLCDSRGSCATPGHLVVYNGEGMMMKSYCDVVGCSKSVMKVNSPKWERQLRVKSWSDGLEFTAFAARYETFAEELVLAGAVRAGL